MAEGDKTFRIALCMAGTISGDAYTAGVLDFLFEALDEWEKEK
jgi:predicted patatin/cPLA2 family phospholipase